MDFSYELKYGDGTGIKNNGALVYDLNFFENFLKINSNFKDYYYYIELEYSDAPVLGFSKTELHNVVSKFYFDRQFDKTYIKFGDIYSLYGAGLGLYTYPDQSIDFDNSFRGFEVIYNIGNVDLFIVGGSSELQQRTNPAIEIPDRFIDNNIISGGLVYDTDYGYGHFLYKNQTKYIDESTVSSFYLGEYKSSTVFDWDLVDRIVQSEITADSLFANSINLGWGIPGKYLDLYFEGDWSNYDKLLGSKVQGHRLYASMGTNIKSLGLTYEYKNYDMAYDIMTFSSPPTVYYVSSSILASRNAHSMNYGDEIGHQIELVSPLTKNLNFLGNISLSRRNNAKEKRYTYNSLYSVEDYVESYIENNPINEINQGSEYTYINGFLSAANQYVETGQDLVNNLDENGVLSLDLVNNQISTPSLIDLLNYDDSDDNFVSFYPYRQLYAELSGYIKDRLYLKIGFDYYSEIIKHQETKNFNYSDQVLVDIDNAWSIFYNNAQTIINDRWNSFQNDCVFAIQFLGEDNCEGYVNPEEYADYKITDQFGKSREDYLSSLYLGKSIERKYEFVKSWTIPTQFTISVENLSSWIFYIEYQKKETINVNQNIALNNNYDFDEASDFSEYNTYLSASYNSKGLWTLSLFYEHEKRRNTQYLTESNQDWKGLDFSLNLDQFGQISVFYGSQKGGLVCANGICAEQPGFKDGIKLTYRNFF
ncbi:MAG: hypothetical protein CBC84_000550 [Pelagibacteraceae bacterium TMED124]|nr:MAG: hypothetical protein CBC84_000550 [Pelagibacteraceae bacterium TMED124]|tara:strand:- start:6272 stop:8389 length:2118 start_codon:yes stop_codon:yes gene_type:complete